MPLDAATLIETVQLKPHPEGGFYAETFRSPLPVRSEEHRGPRAASTAIYFLLERGDFSALHSVRSDEVWHHYLGDALELVLIDPQGQLSCVLLGSELDRGQRPQAVAARGVLQAARPVGDGAHGFVLCGCTVAPGFDFADFVMPERAELVRCYPQHAQWMTELTRERR